MSQKIKLKCRIPDCHLTQMFPDPDEAKDSSWQEISPLGAMKEDGVRVHRAYCYDHALES